MNFNTSKSKLIDIRMLPDANLRAERKFILAWQDFNNISLLKSCHARIHFVQALRVGLVAIPLQHVGNPHIYLLLAVAQIAQLFINHDCLHVSQDSLNKSCSA